MDRLDRINPYERSRFQIVENITDKQTSAQLQGLIEEGGIANVEQALEYGINQLYKEKTRGNHNWRYYCRTCIYQGSGFISGISRTRAALEDGLRRHCSVDDDHDVTVFRYDPEEIDWDPDRIEEIADEHRADNVHEAIIEVAVEHHPDVPEDSGVSTDA